MSQFVRLEVEVFEDPNVRLLPLARKLQKIPAKGAASNGSNVGSHPLDKNAEEARKLIGAEAWELVMDAVDGGILNPQKMKDIANKLDRRAGGDHNRRVYGERMQCDRSELIRIPCDWWTFEENEDVLKSPVQKLVSLFESDEVYIKPLAKKLEKASPKQGLS